MAYVAVGMNPGGSTTDGSHAGNPRRMTNTSTVSSPGRTIGTTMTELGKELRGLIHLAVGVLLLPFFFFFCFCFQL